MDELIGQHFGQYEIIAMIGSGGMASVYQAKQINVKRDVAIKIIDPRLARMSEDFTNRFRREAETIAKLSHPNILKLFDYGQEGQAVYLVTEFLSGGNLAQVLNKGPLSLENIQQLIDQIASALDYAHSKGIIHRDMKPQNVLFDETGNALLADFGIAKIIGEATALTQTGATMGTPAYMSPEQCNGQEIDARTDIYSLGVILFEMLAGRVPFLADTPIAVIFMHVNQPVPVHKLPSTLPPGVRYVLEKALAKNPDQRFSSANELAKSLKHALAGETLPVVVYGNIRTFNSESSARVDSAHPQTVMLPESVNNPKRRRRSRMMIGALALLVFICGIVGLAAILSDRSTMGQASAALLTQKMTATDKTTVFAEPSTTNTSTLTHTFMPSVTATLPPTHTFMPSVTVTLPPTYTFTPSVTATLPPTHTFTPSVTATFTISPTQTASLTFTPSVTNTVIPTRTPAPTATQPVVMITMTLDFINLRAGPGTNYNIIGQVTKNDQLTVIAQAGSGTTLWYLVTTADNKMGWVFSGNTTVIANAIIPPAATIPASPIYVYRTKVPTLVPTLMAAVTSGGPTGGSTGGGSTGPSAPPPLSTTVPGVTPPTVAPPTVAPPTVPPPTPHWECLQWGYGGFPPTYQCLQWGYGY